MISHPARNSLSSLFGPVMVVGLTLGTSGAVAAYREQDVTLAEETRITQAFYNDTFGHPGQCARLQSSGLSKIIQLLAEFDRDVGSVHLVERAGRGGYSLKNLVVFQVISSQLASAYADKATELYRNILQDGLQNVCDITRSQALFAVVGYAISRYGNIARERDERSKRVLGPSAENEQASRIIYVDPDKVVPGYKMY